MGGAGIRSVLSGRQVFSVSAACRLWANVLDSTPNFLPARVSNPTVVRAVGADQAGELANAASRWPSVDDGPAQDGEHGGHPVTEAFDELFQAYEQKIFNLVYRLVGDYEDAADLTSDTFVRALRGYERFRGEAHPYTWLYRIAVNLCKNYFRQQQHRSRVHSFSLDAPILGEEVTGTREIEDTSQRPQQQVEARELEARVQRCLLALRPDLRALIVLRDVQGLSYREIGQILGCPEKAVKSRLFRARSRLRELLDPYLSG
jgi:RNA polymerase sigma-70 factor (ECF subfamily)